MNPLRYACFEDEDFLQKVKQTGQHSQSVEMLPMRLSRLFPLQMQLRWDCLEEAEMWQ